MPAGHGRFRAAAFTHGLGLCRVLLEELDLLLLTVATPRKVQHDGIHCHGLR